MPIDFIKVVHRNVCTSSLLSNRHLEFTSIFNHTTSEVFDAKCATYHGLKFKLKGKYLTIEGSLHKFSNFGKHNYNDFTFTELSKSIETLERLLNLNSKDFVIHQIEFGVNIRHKLNTSKTLANLICYQNKPIYKGAIRDGDFRSVDLTDFRLKIYDKAIQYGLNYQLIRFEVHTKKMRYIASTDINSLSDLKDLEKVKRLGDILYCRWNDILLFDWTMNKDVVSKCFGAEYYYQIQSFNYWKGLNKNQRNKMKDRYKKVIANHAKDVQAYLAKCIENKFEQLILT